MDTDEQHKQSSKGLSRTALPYRSASGNSRITHQGEARVTVPAVQGRPRQCYSGQLGSISSMVSVIPLRYLRGATVITATVITATVGNSHGGYSHGGYTATVITAAVGASSYNSHSES